MGDSLLVDSPQLFTILDQLPLLAAESSRLANVANNFWLGLQVALGLGFVIFVHELGHFLAAKTFGVRCDKFYVGFDVPISIGPIHLPRTLGKFQWGETEYGIGIIPLGGYVKMLGQDDDPRKAEEEAERIRQERGEDAGLDPRSYPAKPVWQRMIIISAGVIMNLIFAVILAGVAYGFGVKYTPTVAGTTYGGGPAWAAGVEPGDQILQVGSMTEDFHQLRYDDFGMSVVLHGFETGGKPLPLVLQRDGQRLEVTANPTPKYHPKGFYFIGLSSPTKPKIAAPAFPPESFMEAQAPDLKPDDVITAVNGEPLPVDQRFDEIIGNDLTARLQANWEDEVSLKLERPGSTPEAPSTELEIKLPPVPVKTLGLGFEMGPITAIQSGSLAEKAGFQVGDVIQTLNGQPIENALELPSFVARLAGQTITLGIVRGSPATESASADSEESTESTDNANNSTAGSLLEISVANSPVARFDSIAPLAGELTLGGVGIAFAPSTIVSSIDEQLVASDSGIQPGDDLKQVLWVISDARKQELQKYLSSSAFKPIVMDDSTNIAVLYDMFQSIPEGSELQCTVSRDGKMQDPVMLKVQYASDWYWHQRGISLSPLMQVHQADDLIAATQLGFWETKRRFNSVLNFLRLLVTGRIGLSGLGGPGTIAYVAASEASLGVSRLMIFLTMLSANLAILNFLPIPALDGGHMVFLTAEAIRGKPVNEALQVRLTMIGVLGLLTLMAFVIVKDIIFFAT